jgi:hypothetical protein
MVAERIAPEPPASRETSLPGRDPGFGTTSRGVQPVKLFGLLGRSPEELKPPIFVFGNIRSGTTILADLISAHPSLVKWDEPRTLWLYADAGRPHDEFDERDATEGVVRYIRKRFRGYQESHGGLRVLEKTPQNILKLRYVRAIFPEATFLFIVRSPFSYISSVEAKWQRVVSARRLVRRFRETPIWQVPFHLRQAVLDQFNKRVLRKKYLQVYGPRYRGIFEDLQHVDLMTVIARQWAICSRIAERDLETFEPGRVFRLRYEDFVVDAVPYLEKICRHCGIEPTPEMYRMAREVVDPTRQEKWKRFDPERLRPLLPELESEMKRHGYAIPEELQ